MPQLLLELFSEEIPARMQAGRARDLERMARERLTAAELPFERLRAFAGPRRLTLVVDGLPAAQADRTEERKGPRVGAPEQASRASCARRRRPGPAGRARRRLVRDHRPHGPPDRRDHRRDGRGDRPRLPLAEVDDLGRGRPALGPAAAADPLRVRRPDRAVEGRGHRGGDLTEGHRFMGSSQPFRARDFDEYAEAMAGHFVVLDADERKERIRRRRARLCCAARIWSWSRTTACWTRSRAWPNGRCRSWARWTQPSWTCRRR